MDFETQLGQRLVIFVVGSLLNVIFSWRSLHNVHVHGFYRFFIFEGILVMLLINGAMGPIEISDWLKRMSQFLNALAVVLVVTGVYQLRRSGGYRERETFPANKPFENTERLVTGGIYHYVRHPMYGSLIMFAWGICLGYPTKAGAALAVITTLAAYMAAKVEERENAAHFGDHYVRYMKCTAMFIPFLL